MKSKSRNGNLSCPRWIVGTLAWACLCASVLSSAQQTEVGKAAAAAPAEARRFDTPQQAADVLIEAADKFDVVALGQIFGPGGEDIIFSGEFAQDRQHAADFVAQAREKKSVSGRGLSIVGDPCHLSVPPVENANWAHLISRAQTHQLLALTVLPVTWENRCL